MSYAFGRKAVVATVAYMVMRLAVIGLDDALPLFMSTPPPQGGMGFTSNDIGLSRALSRCRCACVRAVLRRHVSLCIPSTS